MAVPKLLVLVSVLVGMVHAQSLQDCEQQSAIVNVIDAHGAQVKNLDSINFRARERGRPVNVLFAGRRSDPGARVTVLLDVSASMAATKDSSKWTLARSAASDFVNSAPPQAPISLMAFGAIVSKSFDAAEGRMAILKWLGSGDALPKPDAKTALYSAILEAVKKLEPTRPGDAIYIITDGGENASGVTRAAVERELLDRGVRLFVFLLNDLYPGSVEGEGAGELYSLAEASGGLTFTRHLHNPGLGSAGSGWAGSGFASSEFRGRAFYDPEPQRVIHATTQWAQMAIASFYILTIAARNDAPQEDWKLEAVDLQGKKRKDLTLIYPRKLAGCTQGVAIHH